ncbi:legumain-like [Stegodyphus dumicola]|uniref:legumain-like n=1 Tax=Stegodyphus dumicola TaxID=202533 RepID=UPI0015B0C863|nr:legumain-like [Stegodyphus dumicola]
MTGASLKALSSDLMPAGHDHSFFSFFKVYATTAANGEESSYACYFDEKRQTYLGDVYSVKWMEDSDQEVLTKETLYHQYKIVKEETTQSHVQKFGDMKIAKMHVSEFQGKKSTVPIILPKAELNAVKSRDVPVELLRRKLMNTDSIVDRKRLEKKLNKMYRNRLFVYDVMMKIANATVPHIKDVYDMVAYHSKLTNFECYDDVRQYFNEECFQLSKNPYVLEFLYVLVNLCEKYPKSQIMQAMEFSCTHPPVHGIM